MGERSEIELRSDTPGRANPHRLEARVLLADLRSRMFRRMDAPTLGRFRLLRVLGRGAHGSVFEAKDETLDRLVAVKVLHGAAASSARRLREARALARLDHPHVVEVYASGEFENGVWIAMELVRGPTLLGWAEQHPVGSPARFVEAHRLLLQAAEGLAAAHDRGLLHRDFKPSNVLVGVDGRARVADFGLARDSPDDDGGRHGLALTLDVTCTGDLVGTPQYMSPEQLRGETLDARSDQFNFAVSAWQVAFGALPFAGVTGPALLQAIEAGPSVAMRRRAVPRWFTEALRRGLAARPDDRFASMAELVRALTPGRSSRSFALAGAMVLGAAVAFGASTAEREVPSCDEEVGRERIAMLWTPERRDTVARALASAGAASDVDARVDAAIRRFVDAWITSYESTCAAARERDGAFGHDFDRRMACLHEASITVDTLLERFASPTSQQAAKALGAIQSLPDPSACAMASSGGEPETPASARLRGALARITADHLAGDDVAVVAGLAPLVAEARGAGVQLALGDALELLGNAWSELNDDRRYEPLMDSFTIAVAAGDDESAMRRATQLARQYAYAQRFDDAERWRRHADASLARRGEEDGRRAALVHVECLLHMRQGRVVEAIPSCERARDLSVPAGGPDPVLRWLVGSDLALAYGAAGRGAEAEALTRELHAAMVEELGASHPRVANSALALARFAANRGETDNAIAYTREALDVFLRVYGFVNTQTSMAYMHLGCLLHRAGDWNGAEEAFVLALRAGDRRRDQWRARSLHRFAELRADQGRHAEALPMLRESLGIMEELWRHNHPEIATIRRKLAATALELGRFAEAGRELEDVRE